MSQCVSSALSSSSATVVADETELWNAILVQHGLGMDRAKCQSWLTYGWEYRDSKQPIQYTEGEKRPHSRTARNRELARSLWTLMETGLSMKKAAARLGIPQSSAVRVFKQHVKPTLSTSVDTIRRELEDDSISQ